MAAVLDAVGRCAFCLCGGAEWLVSIVVDGFSPAAEGAVAVAARAVDATLDLVVSSCTTLDDATTLRWPGGLPSSAGVIGAGLREVRSPGASDCVLADPDGRMEDAAGFRSEEHTSEL